jgi:hypothetical protein
MTRTPATSEALPRTWMTNSEMKLASKVMSPSIRSINSPGVCVVKAHVEVEAVGREIATQPVGGSPGDVLAEIRRGHREYLLRQRAPDEEDAGDHHASLTTACSHGVDHGTQNKRAHELESDARKKQHRQYRDSGPLRPKIHGAQRPILT